MNREFTDTAISLAWLDSLIHRITTETSSKPIAVFDCDGTIIKGDIGEAMFFYQLERNLFRISPRKAWTDYPHPELLDALSIAENSSKDAFAQIALDWYFGQIEQGLTAKACSDIVRLLSGFSQSEARSLANEVLKRELGSTVGTRTLGNRILPKGIRYIRETVEILRKLVAADFDIWVVSGSNQWSVEAVFVPLGVPLTNIIGLETIAREGILTAEIKNPVPVQEGKVEILRNTLPRRPEVVLSDSLKYDLPLLNEATHASIHVLSNAVNGNGAPYADSWVQLHPVTLFEQGVPWQM